MQFNKINHSKFFNSPPSIEIKLNSEYEHPAIESILHKILATLGYSRGFTKIEKESTTFEYRLKKTTKKGGIK